MHDVCGRLVCMVFVGGVVCVMCVGDLYACCVWETCMHDVCGTCMLSVCGGLVCHDVCGGLVCMMCVGELYA